MIVSEEGTDIRSVARECSSKLFVAKGIITKLHSMGRNVSDLLHLYFESREPLINQDYKRALGIAQKVHDRSMGMLELTLKPEDNASSIEESTVEKELTGAEVGLDFEMELDEKDVDVSQIDIQDDLEKDVELECPDCGNFYLPDDGGCSICFEADSAPGDPDHLFIDVKENDPEEMKSQTVEFIELKGSKPKNFNTEKETSEVNEYLAFEMIEEKDTQDIGEDVDIFLGEESFILMDDPEGSPNRSLEMELIPEDQISPDRVNMDEVRDEMDSLVASGDSSGALALLNKYIKDYPNDVVLHNEKALFLNISGNFKEAIIEYDRSLEIDPKSVETWMDKGYAQHSSGEIVDAFYCYEKARELDPENTSVLTSLGALYFEGEEYDKADQFFTLATDLNPEDPDLWNYRAFINERRGRFMEALKIYDNVLELDPFHREALIGRDNCLSTIAK